jgi:hypothetical protein
MLDLLNAHMPGYRRRRGHRGVAARVETNVGGAIRGHRAAGQMRMARLQTEGRGERAGVVAQVTGVAWRRQTWTTGDSPSNLCRLWIYPYIAEKMN